MNRYRSTPVFFILAVLLSLSHFANSEDLETRQLIDVIYAGRQFVAIRAEAKDISVELDATEAPLWSRASGSLAAVVTSHRFLIATATSPAWREKPLHVEGGVKPKAYLSADLVLVSSHGWILGYDRVADTFLERDTAPAAGKVLAVITEHGAGAIALEHEAVGYVVGSNEFVSIAFQPDEVFSSASAESGTLSIVTSTRKLSLSKGHWSEAPLATATPR